jgi:hypothetical protein
MGFVFGLPGRIDCQLMMCRARRRSPWVESLCGSDKTDEVRNPETDQLFTAGSLVRCIGYWGITAAYLELRGTAFWTLKGRAGVNAGEEMLK